MFVAVRAVVLWIRFYQLKLSLQVIPDEPRAETRSQASHGNPVRAIRQVPPILIRFQGNGNWNFLL